MKTVFQFSGCKSEQIEIEGSQVHAASRAYMFQFCDFGNWDSNCATKIGEHTIHMVCCGTKGDWAFVRKATGMQGIRSMQKIVEACTCTIEY